jgi:hypothetical protein
MGSAVSSASLLRSRSRLGTKGKFPSAPLTELPVMRYRSLEVSGRRPINCSTFSPHCEQRPSRCCSIHNPGLTEPVLLQRSTSMRSPHGQRAKQGDSSQFDTVIFHPFCRRLEQWIRASMSSLLPTGLPDLESRGQRAEQGVASSVFFNSSTRGRSFANNQDRSIFLFCAIPMHALRQVRDEGAGLHWYAEFGRVKFVTGSNPPRTR